VSIFHRIRQHWRHQPGILPWLTSWPARGTVALLSLLPAAWASQLGAMIGAVIWWIPRRRQIGRENLLKAMPSATQKERDKILKASCCSMGRMGVEMMVVLEKYRHHLLERVKFEGDARQVLESLQGQGAIFMQGHLGGFEVFGAVLGQMKLNPGFIMRPPTNVYVERRLVSARQGWGCTLWKRHGAVRKMMSHLKEGGAVVLASDQNAHRNPIFVPWFGELAATERAAAALALKTNAPVVLSWSYRSSRGTRWTIGCQVLKPSSHPTVSKEQAVYDLTLRIHQALEKAILKKPGQYLWVHNRYRVRPEDVS